MEPLYTQEAARKRQANRAIPESWEPLRDSSRNVVTITRSQLSAIWKAVEIVEAVRRSEGYPSMFEGSVRANLAKSRLLGRILLDGKGPTVTKPPLAWGGPEWSALDGGDPWGWS